jgi:hypothetical protein
MKLKLEVVSVVQTKNKPPYIIFGCSLNDMLSLAPLLEDTGIKFYIESAPEDKINGFVYSITGASNTKMEEGEEREAKCKIKIVCPEIEKIKVAELSTLTGQVLDFVIDIS